MTVFTSVSGTSPMNVIRFDGMMTEDMRLRIKNRLQSLHATKNQLATVLNVSTTTLHNWFDGRTMRCSFLTRGKLQEFLEGGYDKKLLSMQQLKSKRQNTAFPDPMVLCLERIAKLYDFFNRVSPQLGSTYMLSLEKVANQAMNRLMPRESRNFPLPFSKG